MAKTVLLGDVSKYVTDKVSVDDILLEDYVSTENLLPGRAGLVRAANLPQTGKVTKFENGDVLVSNIRPYFKKIWFANRDGGASNDVLVFRPTTSELKNEYLRYVLADDKFFDYSTASAGGSKMPRGDKIQLLKYPVYLPSIEEQQTIAGILGRIDEKIELNRRMNETLEQIGQTLFKHYFIDNPESKSWSWSRIGKECDVLLGGTPSRAKSKYWEDGTVGWINSGKVNEFRITEASEFITEAALNNSAAKLLPAGTTVLAITGATLGQVSRIERSFAANQSVIGIIGNDKYSNEFLYLWINLNIDKLIGNQTGGAQQHINRNDVTNFKLPALPKEISTEFQKIIEPIMLQIKNNCFESDNLIKLRDSLLPHLISGKIKV